MTPRPRWMPAIIAAALPQHCVDDDHSNRTAHRTGRCLLDLLSDAEFPARAAAARHRLRAEIVT